MRRARVMKSLPNLDDYAWSKEEVEAVHMSVARHCKGQGCDPDQIDWQKVHEDVPTKTLTQIRLKYTNGISPKISNDAFSKHENMKILESIYLSNGYPKWDEVS